MRGYSAPTIEIEVKLDTCINCRMPALCLCVEATGGEYDAVPICQDCVKEYFDKAAI
jgi:hypothetical protein